MPELRIKIGGREYAVSCGAGEEEHLLNAASKLDAEAARLIQAGQSLGESRMLLMAGLMVADQVGDGAGADPAELERLGQDVRTARAEAAALQAALTAAETARDEAFEARSAAEKAATDAKEAAGAGAEDESAELQSLRTALDASKAEADDLRKSLEAAEARLSAQSDSEDATKTQQVLLEKMAAELERLADELEGKAAVA